MTDPGPRDGSTAGILTWMLILTGVLLVVLVAVRRREYPEGTIVNQERTVVIENLNPELDAVLADVVPGATPIADVQQRLGEPTAKLEEDGLAIWIYSRELRQVRERALFGLIPTGESTWSEQTVTPVGVKDGLVVHTVDKPSPDEPTRQAMQRMWTSFARQP